MRFLTRIGLKLEMVPSYSYAPFISVPYLTSTSHHHPSFPRQHPIPTNLPWPLPPCLNQPPGAPMALFRSFHLSIFYKRSNASHDPSLYAFAIDKVSLNEPSIVWERIEDVDGGSATFGLRSRRLLGATLLG
ncbi:hypothetical protein BDP27DRAFT_760851 [Rhodocollybia butyracea]|uniref:MINDY deubiquitinase domain-containing protein n=1 Tax=Rhodocollybia butyracea TaxID=206335 RepID=A0A9P5P2V5_9AGAR|nr:hypothetical protein BDP27DRAFT_760851 [Rhodocollybia butyracea]